jgi:hypothetical protein
MRKKTMQLNIRPSTRALEALARIVDVTGTNQTAIIEFSIAFLDAYIKSSSEGEDNSALFAQLLQELGEGHQH